MAYYAKRLAHVCNQVRFYVEAGWEQLPPNLGLAPNISAYRCKKGAFKIRQNAPPRTPLGAHDAPPDS